MKTVISNSGVVEYKSGTGLTINENLTVSGVATFSGGTSGVTVEPNVGELDDVSLNATETYDCSTGTRAFRYNTAPGGNWTVGALTNLSLLNSQSTTVKILFPAPAADRTVTLSGMTINGVSVTQANPASIKASKDKCTGVVLDVIKNSAGNFYVYASSRSSG